MPVLHIQWVSRVPARVCINVSALLTTSLCNTQFEFRVVCLSELENLVGRKGRVAQGVLFAVVCARLLTQITTTV